MHLFTFYKRTSPVNWLKFKPANDLDFLSGGTSCLTGNDIYFLSAGRDG